MEGYWIKNYSQDTSVGSPTISYGQNGYTVSKIRMALPSSALQSCTGASAGSSPECWPLDLHPTTQHIYRLDVAVAEAAGTSLVGKPFLII